jgi:hypothetical protein
MWPGGNTVELLHNEMRATDHNPAARVGCELGEKPVFILTRLFLQDGVNPFPCHALCEVTDFSTAIEKGARS